MRLATICCTLALLPTAFATEKTPATGRLKASVDPRVELLSIIFRLAGHPEYNQPNSQSPYSDDVAKHFGPFREHAVVQTARQLRGSRGVSYDAVMSMAMHIEDTQTLKERIPFDQRPPRLDERWRTDEARTFLEQARDFVKQTDFNGFYKAHQALYDTTAARLEEQLATRDYLTWFDAYFGARPGARFHVYAGLLLGGCCYGSGIQFPNGKEEITPILGVWEFDSEGLPVISEGITPTVVHELCHSYTNAIVDRHADALQPAGERIFATCADKMRQMAYGEWKTMVYESLVRVCVVRYLRATDGPSAANQEIQQQHDKGFAWIGALSRVLEEYEADRKQYATLDAFMPRIVRCFEDYAATCKMSTADSPQVVSMTPANGAQDVDPGLTEITVTFDRPMQNGMWSVVGGGPHFPEIVGEVHYDKALCVFTMPVRLKPDWSYKFWLNRGQYSTFRSAEGVPLSSVEVNFKTRAK